MEKNKNIDELITEALNEEQAEFYKKLDEQSMPEMFTGLFQDKLRWITILSVVMMLIWLGLAIYCAIQFFNTDDLKMLITWSGGFFFCMMAVLAFKIWNWMQMDKNALMREIKRLELQISMLRSNEK